MATPDNIRVNYLSRDFATLREDLISFAKQYHSDKFAFFNDANPDMMYLEMVAYVGDVLSFYTDKTFNESFLTTALARESLVRIANDLGFFEFGPTPSQTQVILSINVPFVPDGSNGNVKPDPDLLIAIESGMALAADNGQQFEILEEVNFANARNRRIIPNLDSNNQIIDYTIEKTAVAKAGTTKIQRFFVTPEEAKPFLQVTLDDTDVTEVVGVVSVPGNVFAAPPDADFIDPDKAFFEARTLIEGQKFLELNPIDQLEQQTFEETTIRPGNFVDIPKRFITRRDVNGLVTLTFGSGSPEFDAFNNTIQTAVDADTLSLNQVLNNTALGEIPPPNSTLFIRYRQGGGDQTNVDEGQINTIVSKTFFPAPGTANVNDLQATRNSLQVRNELPAIGGKGTLTNEEIRQSAGKVFAAQDRGVTFEDIKTLIGRMPPEFGRPFRTSYKEIKPRVANFSTMRNGLDTLLNELLQQTSQVDRQLKIDEINTFLNDLSDGAAFIPVDDQSGTPVATSELSANLLGATPTLWLGEKNRLYVLSLDENGHLVTAGKDDQGRIVSPNDPLKLNIRNFLRQKRVIGDWIDVVDGKVINIQIEFTVLVDKKNKQQVLAECLTTLRDFFAIDNWQMNQPIFVSNVETVLQEIDGVINVVDLKFFNIFGEDADSGRQYAIPETGRYFNIDTTPVNTQNNKFEINTVNNVILAEPDLIFEVKFPETDIIGKAL